MWSVKCGVWSLSLECVEGSVKCAVWGSECGGSKQWELRSLKCCVWNVECEVQVWSAKSPVWSVKYEVLSVKEAVRSEKCGVSSLKFGVQRVQCEVCSLRFRVWRKQWKVWSLECRMWSVKFKFGVRRAVCEVWSMRFEVWEERSSAEWKVWIVKFEVWCAKSAVWREGQGPDRLFLNYRSFIFGKLLPLAWRVYVCCMFIYIFWVWEWYARILWVDINCKNEIWLSYLRKNNCISRRPEDAAGSKREYTIQSPNPAQR